MNGAANGGWFVGSGSTNGAVRWHDGLPENLQAFGKPTELTDINASGVSVGMTYDLLGFADGAVVHRNGQFSYLPIPSGRRMGRAFVINDAGDIAGTAHGDGDNFVTTLWPADNPGTVQVINPDPAVYGYLSPIGIDEQRRVLVRAEGWSKIDHFVRHPDGTTTKLPMTAASISAFRNGRISGQQNVNGTMVTTEWDLTGRVVRRLAIRAQEPVVDSGTLTAGTYRTADNGYALGVWDGDVLTHTLVTSPNHGGFSRPVITDDGLIATSISSSGAVVTFRRTCS